VPNFSLPLFGGVAVVVSRETMGAVHLSKLNRFCFFFWLTAWRCARSTETDAPFLAREPDRTVV
jgi:hypothetical protein